MTTNQQATRWLAIILIAGVGLNEILHAIFDGMEFEMNAKFVGTVLSMEFTPYKGSWRAVTHPIAGYIGYALIWIAHAASGALCFAGMWQMRRARNLEHESFAGAATWAIAGIGVGCVLYLIGFVSIASGWFMLHLAPTPPNFVGAAEMLFLCYAAVLLYVSALGRR